MNVINRRAFRYATVPNSSSYAPKIHKVNKKLPTVMAKFVVCRQNICMGVGDIPLHPTVGTGLHGRWEKIYKGLSQKNEDKSIQVSFPILKEF